MDRSAEATICGIATPVGDGGIGIVRLSGRDAVSIGERVVRLRSGASLRSRPSHRLFLADIVFRRRATDEGDRIAMSMVDGEVIDEGLVVVMKSPGSFTGEDIVEIHCHGGSTVLGLVCDACLGAGARLADPGEFTKRAFLNGRLDLSQAEAVLDTIQAKSDASLRIAQRHLRGELGNEIKELRNRLLALLSGLEAEIDFSEEDMTFVKCDDMVDSIAATIAKIERMLGTAAHGIRLRDGARVVITGRPNVGKSSLLNALLGEDRAIVTDVPGTTRDVIEESVVWRGVRLVLIDTAGVRETDDVVEQEGIKRTGTAIEEADVVVEVVDASQDADENALRVMGMAGRCPDLVVVNKVDLVEQGAASVIVKLRQAGGGSRVIATSVRTGEGLDRVRASIAANLSSGPLEADGGAVVTNIRHRDALERARVPLARALNAVRSGVEPEFVVIDVRESADALGEVTGAITSEEILNHIFSQFCIGK